MTRVLAATLASTLIVGSFTPAAPRATSQLPADFTGTWVLTESRGEIPGRPGNAGFTPNTSGGGGGGGLVPSGTLSLELAIAHDAGRLTVERRFGAVRQTLVYALDGTEHVSTTTGLTRTTRSRWDGATLVTEGTQVVTSDEGSTTTTFTEWIWIDEGRLRVETTREGRPTSQQTYERRTGRHTTYAGASISPR